MTRMKNQQRKSVTTIKMSHILSIKKCKKILTTDLMCMQLSIVIAKLDIYTDLEIKEE